MKRFHRYPRVLRGCIILAVTGLALLLSGNAFANPPVLELPDDESTIDILETFQFETEVNSWVRVQFAEENDFSPLACDTGWFTSGFDSTISWGYLEDIYSSGENCPLDDQETYFWRVQWGDTGGSPDTQGPWSDTWSFTVDLSDGEIDEVGDDEGDGENDLEPVCIEEESLSENLLDSYTEIICEDSTIAACRAKDVWRYYKNWLGNVLWRYHLIATWCYNKGKVTKIKFTRNGQITTAGAIAGWDFKGHIAWESTPNGLTPGVNHNVNRVFVEGRTDGKFQRCVLGYCWGTKFPWVRVIAEGDGDLWYSTGD